MISKRGISLALASVAAAGAIAVPAFALASGGDGASTALTDPVVVQQEEGGTEGGEACEGRHHHGMRGAALAEALGIDVETLQSAAEAARESLGERPDEITPEVIEERRAAFVSALAGELGISESEITSAMETLQAERLASLAEKLADAVEDGRLTQEEADEILEDIENGERPAHFRLRFHRAGHFGEGGGGTSEPTGDSV
jgi:hypothetical protein